MRRRYLLAASTACAVPFGLGAQAARKARLALVITAGATADMSETDGIRFFRAFLTELRRQGYAEDGNLAVERWIGDGSVAGHPVLARNVVASRPDVIFAVDGRLGAALLAATRELPIVLAGGNLSGLVKSLARPGGSLTGVSIDDWGVLEVKRVELLRESVPTATSVAYLSAQERYVARVVEAARQRGLQLIHVPLVEPIGPQAYRQAFAALEGKADLLCPSDISENFTYRALIVELAAQHRLPAIYAYREFVEIGGLMSYGTDLADWGRLSADYVARVLKGGRAAEMPVRVHDKFELVVNLKTARALGLTIPPAILARADDAIE